METLGKPSSPSSTLEVGVVASSEDEQVQRKQSQAPEFLNSDAKAQKGLVLRSL